MQITDNKKPKPLFRMGWVFWREHSPVGESSAPSLYYLDSLILNRLEPYKDKALLHQKYVEEGLSARQISSQFFCSITTVKDHLNKFGIPVRKPRHHHGNPSIPRYGIKVRQGKSEPHLAERRVIRAVTDLRAQGLSLLPSAPQALFYFWVFLLRPGGKKSLGY